jgi:mono/diheme cytochrome c family protein
MIARLLGVACAALATLFMSVAVAPIAEATGCNVRRAVVQYHQQAYAAPVYTAPVAIATYVPVPLLIPAYGVSYDDGRLQKLQAELDALRKQHELLQNLLAPGAVPEPRKDGAKAPPKASAVPVPPAKSIHAGLGVLLKHCASCHDAATATAKGSGVVLSIGNDLAALSTELRLATIRALLKGTMPKGGKISDEDATLVLDLVAQ